MKYPRSARLVALALVAGLAGGAAGTAQTRRDPAAEAARGLWKKAVEIFRANRDWYPERAAIVSDVRGGRKKLLSHTEMFFTLSPDAKGQLRVRLDRALRNGVDTTKKTRSKVKRLEPLMGVALGDTDASSISLTDGPFDPAQQDAVTFTPRIERQTLSGRSCRSFDFTLRPKPGTKGKSRRLTWRGQAWLDEGSGHPVSLTFSVVPLPARIRSVTFVYHYDTERPDRWVLDQVAISGSGSFLFIKRYFTVTTTFSRYRRSPAPAAVKR